MFMILLTLCGWDVAMEDAHATVLQLDENGEDDNTFFAVYDGHGGTFARSPSPPRLSQHTPF